MLAVCLPLAAAWMLLQWRSDASDGRSARLIAGSCLLLLLLLGIVIARSRAGVLMGSIAVLSIAGMVWLQRRQEPENRSHSEGVRRWLLGMAVLGVLVCVQYGFFELWARFSVDPLEDQRWSISSTTRDAIGQFGFLGSGPGTFIPVYQSTEPPEARTFVFVNRAHNDWLEWRLEGGWPLIALVAAGVIMLGFWTRQALHQRGGDVVWSRAAALGLWLLLLHSLFDYPLRTTALAAVTAVLVGCLLDIGRGPSMAATAGKRRRRRSSRTESPRDPGLDGATPMSAPAPVEP
jgi:hypothetical protein